MPSSSPRSTSPSRSLGAAGGRASSLRRSPRPSSSADPQDGDGAGRARDEPPGLCDADAHPVDLVRPGLSAELESDLPGAMESGRLEDVPASEGSAGSSDGEGAREVVLPLRRLPSRLAPLRESDRLEV